MANSQKSTITGKKFEELLLEQKSKEILKWSDLEEEEIYEINSFRNINTKNGISTIIVLSDETEVWAPSSLSKRLQETDQVFPAYVRPKGKTKSQKTGNMYWNFDLVFSKTE